MNVKILKHLITQPDSKFNVKHTVSVFFAFPDTLTYRGHGSDCAHEEHQF